MMIKTSISYEYLTVIDVYILNKRNLIYNGANNRTKRKILF